MRTTLLASLLAAVLLLGRPAAAQIAAPELAPNDGWLNTDKPLRLSDELKGHVVLLDFWTYCCINCMHILPDLDALEEKYKNEPFIVIGVHSAKFANESDRQSIRNAVFRYNIHHPVVIDHDMSIWRKYEIDGWPGFVVIGSDGKVIGSAGGEGQRDLLDKVIAEALAKGKANKTLAATPFRPTPDASVPSATGLAFPGKVLAVAPRTDGQLEKTDRGGLFIADSNHNRIILATWPGDDGSCNLVRIIGAGLANDDKPARDTLVDGDFAAARFLDPQGMAYDAASSTLYVADTKNHAIRAVDLIKGAVRTLVGNGRESDDRVGGNAGPAQGLNSPWDLALSPDAKTLYVAMAGRHQLWRVDIATAKAEALAGSGIENINAGATPADEASLAQPSGLTLDPTSNSLYFVDSESSSVRRLDLAKREVTTILGAGLFNFGDVDGGPEVARLQHPLGITRYPGPWGLRLLVADTYNHKIRLVDPVKRTIEPFMGVGRGTAAGVGGGVMSRGDLRLDEPGGLSLAGAGPAARLFIADTNNHRIVIANPAQKTWAELLINGLADDPQRDAAMDVPASAAKISLPLKPGAAATLNVSGKIPAGAHPNAEAPITLLVRTVDAAGKTAATIAQRTLRADAFPVSIDLPAAAVKDGATLYVELSYAYCTNGENSTCVPGESAWLVTVKPGDKSEGVLSAGAL